MGCQEKLAADLIWFRYTEDDLVRTFIGQVLERVVGEHVVDFVLQQVHVLTNLSD